MNTPEPLFAVPERNQVTEAPSQSKEERMTAHRPAKVRRERRFEIGFFVRKIVNGWVTFYKQFPPDRRAEVLSILRGQASEENALAPQLGKQLVARSHSDSGDVSSGDVTAHSGPGMGSGDPGPVGGTRVEVGFFAAVTTTTDEDGSTDS
jgi:hypothetical protein